MIDEVTSPAGITAQVFSVEDGSFYLSLSRKYASIPPTRMTCDTIQGSSRGAHGEAAVLVHQRVGALPWLGRVVAASMLLLSTGTVSAQTLDPDSLTDEAATALYDEGVKASKAGQMVKARELFAEAWARAKDYQIAVSLGRTESVLGRYRDAAEHLSYFLREVPKDVAISPRELLQIKGMFEASRAKVGLVHVDVRGQGADVLVDGQPVGRAPLAEPIFVDPGEHAFEIKMDGFVTGRASITAEAGREHTIHLELTKRAPVIVTPPTVGEPKTASGDSGRGALSTPTIAMFAGFGVGVAGLITGALAFSSGASRSRDALAVLDGYRASTAQCELIEDCRLSYNDALRDEALYKNVAVWAFIGAGAGLAVGIGLGVHSLAKAKPKSGEPSVALDFYGTGFFVTTRW